MRVAHLVERPADIGGVPTYLSRLIPALAEAGVDSVFCTGDASLDVLAGAACVYSDAIATDGATIDAHERDRLLSSVGGVGADVIYVHHVRNPAVVAAVADLAPVVFYAHDYYPVCPGSMRYLQRSERLCVEGPGLRCFWRAYTERSTNRRPDRLLDAYARVMGWRDVWDRLARVFVASPFVAELLEHDGIAHDRLRTIPLFTEQLPVEPATVEQDVLFLGRLVAPKGAGVLLHAVAELDGVTVAIAGDGPARGDLERLASRLGLDDRVRFLGWTSPDDRSRLFSGSRVVAVPSLWDEPFGIVGIEALAAGIPVVGSAVGGIPSWLTDGEGGLLVPRGDAKALAAALSTLLSEPDRWTEQRERAMRAASRFTLAAHIDLLLGELQSVVSSH